MPHTYDVSFYSKRNFKYKSFAKYYPKGIRKIINNYIGSSGSEMNAQQKKQKYWTMVLLLLLLLFYFTLFYFILFYFILFYFVSCHKTLLAGTSPLEPTRFQAL